ncbi:hypothetical protein GQ42DRAFT_160110, partial [Ramicandelaber brevisporus]
PGLCYADGSVILFFETCTNYGCFSSFPLTPLFLTNITVLVFWLHRIPLLLPLSRGFRSVSVCLSVCLVTLSARSVGRFPAVQDASRSLLA